MACWPRSHPSGDVSGWLDREAWHAEGPLASCSCPSHLCSQTRAHPVLALGGPNVCQELCLRWVQRLPILIFFPNEVQFCWMGIYPRCSGTVANTHSILQVSCSGSKPIVVILISLISGWLGIRHGKSARGAFGDSVLPHKRRHMGGDILSLFT